MANKTVSLKKQLYNTNFMVCPVCKAKDIKMTKDVKFVRMSGDAQGEETYKCGSCSYTTCFKFDEKCDSYYPEVAAWSCSSSCSSSSGVKGKSKEELFEFLKESVRFRAAKHVHNAGLDGDSLFNLSKEQIAALGLGERDTNEVYSLVHGK
eukprot:CAMPEP_0201523206 /NCGR_PEP_ID=MMETSP0161_2-20130828/18975_1 /ASSEMBLY_ACC=CAM_ASM_000251 /TAXON_ID=180227 /ORGANISM="Neoparamoeba aestuarina, Strain SoJaBio B1-5/56/2" /LENGTH=150 /DNA_ID=CAMNT_0047922235 /DNA_START=13 /DNA_END=465 /DNA_ORIENTATION=+